MRTRRAPAVAHNRLPGVLAALGVSPGELARRTLLPSRRLARLRGPHANPPLPVAQRIAAALGLPVEALFRPAGGPRVPRVRPTRSGLGPLLAERRCSDVALARASGLDRAHLNRIKNGRAVPSVRTALAIAAALGADVASVFPADAPRRRRPRPRGSAAPLPASR
jgi:transcriptional regulator with XRE-family HTH domain